MAGREGNLADWQKTLTGLVGGDVYGDVLSGIWTLVADAVDSLYLKAVERVGQQVADEHPGVRQAQLARDKVHVFVTVRAGAPVSAALLAHDVVNHVVAAARLSGGVPLKDDRGLVNDGNHVARAGRDTCAHQKKKKKTAEGQQKEKKNK